MLHYINIRKYGLTSFAQQSGRGGRRGEQSSSYVLLRASSQGRQRPAVATMYSVEEQDEEALSEFLEASSCRRAVLARHLDGEHHGRDCVSSQSVLCDQCRAQPGLSTAGLRPTSPAGSTQPSRPPLVSGSQAIASAYSDAVRRDEALIRVLDELKRHCIFCQLVLLAGDQEAGPHSHGECPKAAQQGCSLQAYQQWRRRLQLAPTGQCFRCGLAGSLCTAIEQGRKCSYYHILLPGVWILHQQGELASMCRAAGYAGEYEDDGWQGQWQWLREESTSQFGEPVLNWMLVWAEVQRQYNLIKGAGSA